MTGVVSATGVALTVFAGPAESRCDQHGGETTGKTSVSAATMFGSPIAGPWRGRRSPHLAAVLFAHAVWCSSLDRVLCR
jgi:hypothetical protein